MKSEELQKPPYVSVFHKNIPVKGTMQKQKTVEGDYLKTRLDISRRFLNGELDINTGFLDTLLKNQIAIMEFLIKSGGE